MFLNLKAMAQYSSCSVRWLRARMADPITPIPHYRVGRKLLFKPEEFDTWLSRYRAVSRAELGQLVEDLAAPFVAQDRAS